MHPSETPKKQIISAQLLFTVLGPLNSCKEMWKQTKSHYVVVKPNISQESFWEKRKIAMDSY